jgi:hypothetical protein
MFREHHHLQGWTPVKGSKESSWRTRKPFIEASLGSKFEEPCCVFPVFPHKSEEDPELVNWWDVQKKYSVDWLVDAEASIPE